MSALLVLATWLCVRTSRYIAGSIPSIDISVGMCAAAFALGGVTIERYDALVSMLLCLMCWAAVARRPIALGAAAGAAIMVKLVPLVAIPIFAMHLMREHRWRELRVTALAAAATAIVICLPFLSAGTRVLDVLRYAVHRPLEFESAAAAVLALWHSIDHSSATITFAYGSTNVTSHFDQWGIWLTTTAGVVATAVVYTTAWRALVRARDAERPFVLIGAVVAVLALTIAFAKVSSVQYLIWLAPLGVLTSLARSSEVTLWLFIATLLSGQIVYPFAAGAGRPEQPRLRSAVRDYGSGAVGARSVQLLGPRHGQHGNPRTLR